MTINEKLLDILVEEIQRLKAEVELWRGIVSRRVKEEQKTDTDPAPF